MFNTNTRLRLIVGVAAVAGAHPRDDIGNTRCKRRARAG